MRRAARRKLRVGLALTGLGFSSQISCPNCSKWGALSRESTGEVWCPRCGSNLYEGTRRREEVSWYFYPDGPPAPGGKAT